MNLPAGFCVLKPLNYGIRIPAQIYSNFYGNPAEITKITNIKAGEMVKIHSEQLKETRSMLYFFKQYQYMNE